MLDSLRAEHFESLRGRPLALVASDGQIDVEIKDIVPLRNPSPRDAPFSVTFRACGAQRSGPQGLYRLDLPGTGTVDLFIVPIGPDGQGMCYQAIFN